MSLAPRVHTARRLPLLLACATLLLSGCGDKKVSKPQPTGSLTLSFEYRVDAAAVRFDATDYPYVNAAGNHYRVSRLKHYVSDVKLRRLDGSDYATTDVFLLDAFEPASLSFTLQGIPAGSYSGIEFLIGVDDDRNVEHGLSDTVENFNMQWPRELGGGYHHVQMEGHYLGEGVDSTWTVHLGKAKHNPSDTFYHSHVAAIAVPASGVSIAENDHWTVRLAMDVNQWFTTPENYDFSEFGSYIMENHEAQEILSANARDAFTVVSRSRE
ncbi:MAG: MbnP family protein [Candidatus Eisenbacteria bacterium]